MQEDLDFEGPGPVYELCLELHKNPGDDFPARCSKTRCHGGIHESMTYRAAYVAGTFEPYEWA